MHPRIPTRLSAAIPASCLLTIAALVTCLQLPAQDTPAGNSTATAPAAAPDTTPVTMPKPGTPSEANTAPPPASLTMPPPGSGTPRPEDAEPAMTLTRPAPAADVPGRDRMPAPPLPMKFETFAADFKPKASARQKWLTVQIGTIEIANASPPGGAQVFAMPNLPDGASEFQPVELACLLGTKSRYENVTMIEADPAGNALGYSLPMGRVVYFIARDEVQSGTNSGISVSLYYYDAASLDWLPNQYMRGSYFPRTTRVELSRDIPMAPAEQYVFIYLGGRSGPSKPGSTRDAVFSTYLVFNMHKVDAGSAEPAPAPAQGKTYMGEKLMP